MRIDKQSNKLWVSPKELRIISSALVEFYQEMHWKLDAAEDQGAFTEAFNNKFGFLLLELDYVMQEFWELEWNFRQLDAREVRIFFSEMSPPKKPLVIYTALRECKNNFTDYEMDLRAGLRPQDLDRVYRDFKVMMADSLGILTKGPDACLC